MLEIQKYLLNHFLEEIKSLGINYKLYNDCILLSYDKLDGIKNDIRVMECRGLILSLDYKTVLCKPFTRFFNYGEMPDLQKEFSFDNAYISSKEDGTLVNVWYHPEKGWCFATRNMAFAEGEISNGLSHSFIEAIYKCFSNIPTKQELEQFFQDTNITWSFEFVSPENRVVTQYDNSYSLYLLAGHNNTTGEYIEDYKQIFQSYQSNNHLFDFVKYPLVYNLNSLQEIREFMKLLRDDQEGFVCYDYISKIRVKVKNPKYLELHHLRGNGITERKIIELIFSGEEEEYLTYFPYDRQFFIPYIKKYHTLISDIEQEYDKVKHIQDKKEFALTIQNNPYKTVLFQMGNKSIGDILNNLNYSTQKQLLEK